MLLSNIYASKKLSLNDDFSFVRFLKVVKTLYESSTFTQLGRTVGSALKFNRDDAMIDDDEEDETLANGTRSTLDYEDETTKKPAPALHTSLLDALTGCTSPDQFGVGQKSPQRKKASGNDPGDPRESRQGKNVSAKPANFLEQVMNCTLGADGNVESDEDTYNGVETQTTFESDGYESAPRNRNRGTQRR